MAPGEPVESSSEIALSAIEMWGLLLAAVVPVLAAVRIGPHASRAPALTASLIALAAWCVGAAVTTGSPAIGTPPPEILAVAVAGCLWLGARQWTSDGRGWLLPVSISAAAAVAVLASGPYWDLHTPVSAPAAIAAAFALLTGPQVITDLARGGQMRSVGPRVLLTLCIVGPIGLSLAWALWRGPAEFALHPVAYLPLAGMLSWLVTSRGVGATGMAAISEPIIFVDGQGQVVDGNPAAFTLLGVVSSNPQMLHRQVMGVPGLRRLLEDPTRECGEFFTGTTVGDRRCYEARVLRSAGEAGEVRVLSVQDVTSRRESERQLFHQAHFDSLTGLANRRYFLDRLEDALEAAQGSDDSELAVMYVDLDRFKEINDTFGHAAGDELLRTMAHRLRQHLRLNDLVSSGGAVPSSPTVARLGGDEFALVLTGIGEPEQAEKVAERILGLLSEPVILDGKKVWAAGSVGIALYPQHGTEAQHLLRSADIALYHAKAKHRSSFQFFRPELTAETQRKAALDRHLRGAMASGELELHFQPKVDVSSGELMGAEALLRWRNSELGTVPPKEFIPVAEDFGLIGQIGTWVIEDVCSHLDRWRNLGLPIVPVSINVSPQQFTQMNLTATIAGALESMNLSPSWLEIELTESVILEHDDQTTSALRELQTIGVRIALDDFGTGYSSLSYLNRVPLDVLKMDRNFVRDIHLDPGAEGVVSAVISMAHSLSLEVIAEGVDCDEQIEILQRMGCDQIQGFVFGPAVSEEEFTAILRAGKVELASAGTEVKIEGTPVEEAIPELEADASDLDAELETDPEPVAESAASEASAAPTPVEEPEPDLPAIFGQEPAAPEADKAAAPEADKAAAPEADKAAAPGAEEAAAPDADKTAAPETVEVALAEDEPTEPVDVGPAANEPGEAVVAEDAEDDLLPAPFSMPERTGPVALTGATSAADPAEAKAAEAPIVEDVTAEAEASSDEAREPDVSAEEPIVEGEAPDEAATVAEGASTDETIAVTESRDEAELASIEIDVELSEGEEATEDEELDEPVPIAVEEPDAGVAEDPDECVAEASAPQVAADDAAAESSEDAVVEAPEAVAAATDEASGSVTGSEGEEESVAAAEAAEPDGEATDDASPDDGPDASDDSGVTEVETPGIATEAGDDESSVEVSEEEAEASAPTDAAEEPEAVPYCLVVDDGSDRLGLLAMRMNRIGAMALYARVYDEGLLFVAQEGEHIRSMMVSTTAPVEEVRRLAERIRTDAGMSPSILLVGPGEAPKELLDLRGRCRIWGVREPIDDALLGHLLRAVHERPDGDDPSVLRERARAPYDIMASVESSEGSEAVLLSSLSDQGAFLEMSKLPEVTATIDVEFTLEELTISTVAKVLYRVEAGEGHASGVGVQFVGLDGELQERIAAAVDERAVRCLA